MLRNPWDVSPTDVEVGDVFVRTIKLIVTPIGFRIYVTSWDPSDGIPDGDRCCFDPDQAEAVAEAIFPNLMMFYAPDQMR